MKKKIVALALLSQIPAPGLVYGAKPEPSKRAILQEKPGKRLVEVLNHETPGITATRAKFGINQRRLQNVVNRLLEGRRALNDTSKGTLPALLHALNPLTFEKMVPTDVKMKDLEVFALRMKPEIYSSLLERAVALTSHAKKFETDEASDYYSKMFVPSRELFKDFFHNVEFHRQLDSSPMSYAIEMASSPFLFQHFDQFSQELANGPLSSYVKKLKAGQSILREDLSSFIEQIRNGEELRLLDHPDFGSKKDPSSPRGLGNEIKAYAIAISSKIAVDSKDLESSIQLAVWAMHMVKFTAKQLRDNQRAIQECNTILTKASNSRGLSGVKLTRDLLEAERNYLIANLDYNVRDLRARLIEAQEK